MPVSELQVTPALNGFGCTIALPSYAENDPSKLNDTDFQKLYDATLTYLVVVLPGLADLPPKSQYILTKRFDPSIPEPKGESGAGYGHGKEFRHTQSVLRKDGTSVKSQPQVQILGQGRFAAGEPGNENGEEISLTHPSHTSFHKDPLSETQIQQNHQTRFYRWHIDSALYDLSPPLVTTLLGIKVPPATQTQTIDYDDGSGDKLSLTQGATCFVSGAAAFDRLSAAEKDYALNTTVEYAPHPYIFISPAKAEKDGLTMASQGLETPLADLPEWEQAKVKKLPMVWTNPVTHRHHLQIHGCCLYKLHTRNGDKTDTLALEAARAKVRELMRPAIAPQNVLAHSWKEGDLVIFFNRGVWHSVTGEFKAVNNGADEKRLMHQCNIASGADPVTVR
ncbi:Clavaminate synthase-like protein [Metschnikowia bicuspidata var. bicuspidata NRRL YB-4993]|uniref:Clavaminate synthase-like protein n=1 Tax=Metschnikowia bicuspidata var. bicuspidata NRRL YB-4993 TaxID=869754 RepID=A0A1A0HAA4_9ASCO|nr:Clavaminate synthase-like protein [Metschnikowia bicuspidata var. bicuspidata NRRL YB-4993]OBA20807.1 Clavaminate synthase-like protein [Metschnikowia bicuspidata var. bicuspidata NRRL YB-4993]